MKCFIFNHDWSHYEPTTSASDRCQIKICKKCGKIKCTDYSGLKFVSLTDLKSITDKYFDNKGNPKCK